jgi:predicted dinucleotide-binding enzyme
MQDTSKHNTSKVAVLGAGHLGSVVARLAIRAGYPVDIAASGDPDDIALITELVIPGAQPKWASGAVTDAGLVVLAIPLHRFLDLSATIGPALLDGQLVIDAMNYWPASDGVLEPFERGGSSEIVAARLTGSTVVKALNHIGYHDLEDHAHAPGAAGRKASGVAGDDPGAVQTVAAFVDRIGYDPVRLTSLRAGRALQPGNPVFGTVLTRDEFESRIPQSTTPPPQTAAPADLRSLR